MMRFLLSLACAVLHSSGLDCPAEDSTLMSESRGAAVSVELVNEASEDLIIYWVNLQGQEVDAGVLTMDTSMVKNSYTGHLFHLRALDNTLVHSYRASADPSQSSTISRCGNRPTTVQSLFRKGEDHEFASLTRSRMSPCVGDDSTKWSCVRHVTKEEFEARDKSRWGFQEDEIKAGRRLHQTIDNGYVAHIPKIPKLTRGPGILLMDMPAVLKKTCLDFVNEEAGKAKLHESVAGSYTNDHKVPMEKINLDNYPVVRTKIVDSMRSILQWWTMTKLYHTSTFGARVYKRGSMLINHVDRADTHLASAVLQLAQDADQGWPLEVIGDDGEYYEVYMQPGQLALYEGARLFHGRPMRFDGDSFTNIFTHFAPIGWEGPHKQPKSGYKFDGPADEKTAGHTEL